MAVTVSGVDNLKVQARRKTREFMRRAKVLYVASQDASWAGMTALQRETLQAEINRLVIATLVLLVFLQLPDVRDLEFDEA